MVVSWLLSDLRDQWETRSVTLTLLPLVCPVDGLNGFLIISVVLLNVH